MMMGYILRKSGLVLIRHRGIYLLLIVEMAIGMSLYVYSGNLSWSVKEKEQSLQSVNTNELLRISVKEGGVVPEELPVDLQDYGYIQGITEEILFFVDIQDILILEDQIIDYDLLFLDFEKYGLDRKCAYIGKAIQSEINKGGNLGIKNMDVVQSQIILRTTSGQQKKFTISYMPAELEAESFMRAGESDENICFSKAILLPITEIEDFFDDRPFNLTGFQLGINVIHSSNREKILTDIEQYLSGKHGDFYHYTFYSPLAELQNNTYKTKLDINSISKIGLLMLAALMTAAISIFRILLERREQELGICQACGAGIAAISMEIITEVFTVCLIGTLLGVICGFALTYRLTSFLTDVVRMQGHWQTVGMSLLVCVFITVVVSLAAIQKFYRKKTIELIRNKV